MFNDYFTIKFIANTLHCFQVPNTVYAITAACTLHNICLQMNDPPLPDEEINDAIMRFVPDGAIQNSDSAESSRIRDALLNILCPRL